jgi:hypothetical protein
MKAESKIQLSNQEKGGNYWNKIIEDQEISGLTRIAYCRKNQINYDNFGYWRKKLKSKSVKSLIPIKIKSEFNQPAEKNKMLSTLLFKNGNSLYIYDKEVLLIILSKMI